MLNAYELSGKTCSACLLSAANMALRLGQRATAKGEYKTLLAIGTLPPEQRELATKKLAEIVAAEEATAPGPSSADPDALRE